MNLKNVKITKKYMSPVDNEDADVCCLCIYEPYVLSIFSICQRCINGEYWEREES